MVLPERIFRKSWFWKKISRWQKSIQNYPVGKELMVPYSGPHNIGPDLDPNCLTLWWYSWKKFSKKLILKKNQQTAKKRTKLRNRQRINGILLSTVKPVLSGHLEIDKTKVFKTNGSLMYVKSIAECSLGAFCNTFDLHWAIIGLENKFWSSFRVAT